MTKVLEMNLVVEEEVEGAAGEEEEEIGTWEMEEDLEIPGEAGVIMIQEMDEDMGIPEEAGVKMALNL